MPPEPPPTLRPGDRLPDFLLPPEGDRQPTFYERYCGRPAVLLIAAPDADGLEPTTAAARAAGAAVHRLDPAPGDAEPPGSADRPDGGRLVRALLGGPPDGPVALVLDATLRLAAVLAPPAADALAAALQRLAADAPPPPAPVLAAAAPVLIVPGVLEPALCDRLIAAYRADNADSPMIRPGADGPVLVADPDAKRRRDHSLTDDDLVRAVTERLSRRVLPEIARGFHYPVTRFERFKVVAYDAADGGHFSAHRDNATPDARHRRFALSINLDDGYEGGTLAFPEFGPAEYRPPAGAALVFSGSHLHAVRPVSAGRRHVLISFLWGEEARGAGPVSRPSPRRAGA